jgi:cobalt-precorrin 5A hydrolase/precorrin-3B C17-methyltransferase
VTGLVIGAGCSRGCPADELLALIDAVLDEAGAQPGAVRALATVDRRADEPGMVAAARHHGWPLVTYPALALRAVTVPTPSAVVAAHVGTPSVAEAAALLSAGADAVLVPKRRSARATCALAASPGAAAREGAP